ncbi:MAG: serine/threonine-protein kinase [Planctomycetota bacterium]
MSQAEPQPTAIECDPNRIGAFLESDHYDLEDPELIAHLDQCDACRAAVESAAGDSKQWSRASELLKPTEFDQAGTPEFSAGTISGDGVAIPASAKEVLDSLSPSDHPDHLGRLGTYEVTGVVGVGGMGVVLKAVDPSLDRIVAVKVMNPRLANNENARKRFAREAKAAAAVIHPNVIPIHSVASDTSLPYLVMACIRGGSLQKRLVNEGPLPLVEVLRIGSQVAAGLDAAHEQGLVHRDIKPENILLEEGVERVTITDFGLARAVDDNTVTQLGSIAGTPQYMSPEQARGDSVDQQSDLFSLGSVLFALLTGRSPFRDDTSYGVMRKIIDDETPSVRELNPDVPDWMSGIIKKLMAKEKDERFASAREVHELLESCLGHVQHPAAHPLPPNLEIKQRPNTRKRIMKTLFGTTVLGILTVWAASYFSAANRPQPGSVKAPLTTLNSIVHSMMRSDYELVTLGVSELTDDDNYVSVKTIEGGVSLRLPVFDAGPWEHRQGQHVSQFRKVAQSLSLAVNEQATLNNAGEVQGANLIVEIKGDADTVAETVRKLITRTFNLEDTDVASFRYYNMPGQYTTKKGGLPPTEVSGSEFVAKYNSGEFVYVGEMDDTIFLSPPERLDIEYMPWDEGILSTKIKDVAAKTVDRIRRGE